MSKSTLTCQILFAIRFCIGQSVFLSRRMWISGILYVGGAPQRYSTYSSAMELILAQFIFRAAYSNTVLITEHKFVISSIKRMSFGRKKSDFGKKSFSTCHIARPFSVSCANFKSMFYTPFYAELITVHESRTKLVGPLDKHVKVSQILEKSPFSESRFFEYFVSRQMRASSLCAINYSVDSPFCSLSNDI